MQPFVLGGFECSLPAGTYELEAEQAILDGMSLPDRLRTSVLIHLHAQVGSPALVRTLTIPWEVLEHAQMRDQAPAELPPGALLAGMLADPIVQLLMLSDGVSEAEVLCVVKAARARKSLQSSCVVTNERARATSVHPTADVLDCPT